MTLRFVKMHGLGNDFVVIDAVRQRVELDATRVRTLADRHRGIGCDQLLLVEPARIPEADFRYRIFNADGGEVEQCGNGARCFARFVREEGLSDADELRVETAGGLLRMRHHDNGQVSVEMGAPHFEPAEIPFDAPARADRYALDIVGRPTTLAALSLGNPHAVLAIKDLAEAPVAELGAAIQASPRFPQGVNVGFMRVFDRTHIGLRVYERGVGETQACGSGAGAAVVAGRMWGLLDETVKVDLTGGRLMIQWHAEGQPVIMTGPAQRVFEGQITL